MAVINLDPRLITFFKDPNGLSDKSGIVERLAWDWISTRREIKTIGATVRLEKGIIYHPSFLPEDEQPFNDMLLNLFNLKETSREFVTNESGRPPEETRPARR